MEKTEHMEKKESDTAKKPAYSFDIPWEQLMEDGKFMDVFLSDVLRAVGVPTEDQNFVGYCYVVGQGIDAIVGSTVNFINTTDPPLQQDFSMQADMEGNDVEIVIP